MNIPALDELTTLGTWTEVVNEDVCVTHVGERHVVVPLSDDVDEYQVRELIEELRRRKAVEHSKRQLRELADELEKQREWAKLMDEYDIDLKKNVTKNTRW